MDHFLTLLYRDGVPLSPHSRNQASKARGQVSIEQQHVGAHHRVMLVASFRPTLKDRTPPVLYEVSLLSWSPDSIVVTGYEHVSHGPLGINVTVKQSWHLRPAPLEDLMKAESMVNNLARQLHELKALRP